MTTNWRRSWQQPGKQSAIRATAIALAAIMLCWPAFLNRFPLLYPDSFEYLYTGWGVWQKLIGAPVSYGAYVSTRSEIFAAGIHLLDYWPSLWPIVAVQAMLTAWVLWLLMRGLRRRRVVPIYLTLVALLSALTEVGWFVSDIMPDILGPLLYLSVYLLAFDRKTLRRWEVAGLAAIVWWATVSHTSHLFVVLGLCCLLGALWLARWKPMRGRGTRLLLVAGTVLLAITTQMAVHKRLYGRASLVGAAPPFLMARLLGDGPARTYLQQNCANLTWTICGRVNDLPTVEWKLMWLPGGIWQTSTPEQKLHLQNEQVPLALATLRAYPCQEIAITWSNFLHMLTATGPWDFAAYPIYTPENLNFMSHGSAPRYAAARQSHNEMPDKFFCALQVWVLLLSVVVAAFFLLFTGRRRDPRLLGLAIVITFALCANAFAGGVFSGPFVRLQLRVDWLLPLLACLLLVADTTPVKDPLEIEA